MNIQIPEYLKSVVENSRDSFCEMLHNPSLWSEPMVRKTLERTRTQTFNIQDVQEIVKDYLTVLSETIRKGEHI